MAKLCLLSDQSLVGQSRTPRANSTEARQNENEAVHRVVSDVEQLIGIHADALFREPNLAGHCGCCRARRPVRGSVHRIALVSGDSLVTDVHQRPRIAIAGAQYRAASPPLTSVAGRTRSWWGAAGSGEATCGTAEPRSRVVGVWGEVVVRLRLVWCPPVSRAAADRAVG